MADFGADVREVGRLEELEGPARGFVDEDDGGGLVAHQAEVVQVLEVHH